MATLPTILPLGPVPEVDVDEAPDGHHVTVRVAGGATLRGIRIGDRIVPTPIPDPFDVPSLKLRHTLGRLGLLALCLAFWALFVHEVETCQPVPPPDQLPGPAVLPTPGGLP